MRSHPPQSPVFSVHAHPSTLIRPRPSVHTHPSTPIHAHPSIHTHPFTPIHSHPSIHTLHSHPLQFHVGSRPQGVGLAGDPAVRCHHILGHHDLQRPGTDFHLATSPTLLVAITTLLSARPSSWPSACFPIWQEVVTFPDAKSHLFASYATSAVVIVLLAVFGIATGGLAAPAGDLKLKKEPALEIPNQKDEV